MSEYINNSGKREEDFYRFALGFIEEKDGISLVKTYKDSLDKVTPHDLVKIVDLLIKRGITIAQIKKIIDKIMNVIYTQLKNYRWKKPEKGHPLFYFMEENRELEKILEKIKKTIQPQNISELRKLVSQLHEFEKHYLRKENILFPYLEKRWENFRCLQLHWSLHDDIRKKLKELTAYISDKDKFDHQLNKLIGELFFLMFGMTFKENLVVFPVAMETLSEEDWLEIEKQSDEIGYAYIKPQKKMKTSSAENKRNRKVDADVLSLPTGNLNLKQLIAMLDTLPLDITFIDENDEVKYFSRPEERFFHRTTAIIGRKVQNCHPPESVHIVEKILDAFKSGKKDKAEFWIQMKGKFILIQYFAVRDETGKYLGTLEASQDITEIKKMEGEKRLLDWEF